MKEHVRLRRAKRLLAEARAAHLASDFACSNRCALELWKLGERAHAAYHQFYYHFRITRDFAKAEAMISFAIQHGIDTHQAWHNLGLARRDQARTLEARNAFGTALAMCPDFVDSLLAFGSTSWELGDDELAMQAWERGLFLEAPEASAKFDQATIMLLLQKQYSRGWRQYAERWQAPLFLATHEKPAGPTWDGAPIETVFLFAEQGNGDAIMLLRWLPWVCQRAQRVHLAVHAPLVQLVRENFPDVVVQRLEDPLPGYHAQCSLFDLPALAGVSSPEGVRQGSYLDAPSPYPWSKGPKRVGLCWAGGTGTQHDWRRSIPFEVVRPLLDVPLGWYVMQLERLEGFDASGLKTPVWHRDIGPLPNFAATARALKSFALLVTVDTSIAHLAGALGVPTWLLIPRMPDFRWGLTGERTEWYPSIRLFRQEKAHDWASVIARVKAELEGWSMEQAA